LVLLAAALVVFGLCVLCGSFLLLLQKQNNHREHREHREHRAEKSGEAQRRAGQGKRRCGSRANGNCGARRVV
jgi:hypothetical protein